MSDVFNNEQSGRKQKILGLLNQPSIPEYQNVEAILYPPQPPDSSQAPYTVLDVVNFVREHKLPIFKPRFISNLELTPLDDKLTTDLVIAFNRELREKELAQFRKQLTEDMTQYFIVPEEAAYLPIGENKRLMSYTPKYYNKPYDVKLLNVITYLVTSPEGTVEALKYSTMTSTFDLYLNAIATKMLSTGTYMGQLSRLSAMRDIRRGLKGKYKPKTLKELGVKMEEFAQQLEYTMPVTNNLNTFALTSVPSSWIYINPETGELDEDLPKLKMRTTGGPPFPSGYKKGAILTSALIIMDNILLDVNDIIRGNITLENFIDKYYYMFCGYMFPKEEIYNKSDVTNKTRNIIAMNSIAHMLLDMMMGAPDAASTFNFLNYDTPSLKGFSPWKGGMHEFVIKVLNTEGTFDLIYADNWYIIYREEDGTYTYFSIDNEKAEANATPDLAQAVIYYLLSRCYITENVMQFSATWAYLLLNIMPATIVDAVAIFRNLQFRVPGMSSGSRATFHVNHAITTKHRMVWVKAGRPRPGTEAFKKVNMAAGVNVKIELEVPDFKTLLEQLPHDTPTDGILQNIDDDGSSSRDWPIVKADLLGYDICWSHELQQYLPVLSTERLMASAAYPKRTASDIVSHAAYGFYRMARYVTLAMMGAFTKPLLYDSVMSMADELRIGLRRALKNAEFDIQAQTNYDNLLPAIVEVLELKTLNVEFTCDRAMLYKLHSYEPQAPAPVQNKVVYSTLTDLKDAGDLARRSNRPAEKLNFTAIPLLATMVSTTVEKLKVFQTAKKLSDTPWGTPIANQSWADDYDTLELYLKAEKDLKSTYDTVLERGLKSLEALLVREVDYDKEGFIPAVYEKDPLKLSNPIIGYHLPYQPTAGILATRKIQGGVSLSKTQRKNLKTKTKNQQAREAAAALRELSSQPQ